MKIKLSNKEPVSIYINRNKIINVFGLLVNEFEYSWSWKKLKFDFWLTGGGLFNSWRTLKKELKKEYNIILEK